MARYGHRDPFRDPSAHHIPYGGPPEVVEQLAGYPCFPTGSLPGFTNIAYGEPLAVKHPENGTTVLQTPFDDFP